MFTLTATCISRVLLLADRLLGRVQPGAIAVTPRISIERAFIPSGKSRIDTVVVRPRTSPASASLLICHGIGEVVEHWTAAQRLLATFGVTSLVFDYSGYGRSSGFINAAQCEQDAIAAFQHLETLTPSMHVSVLGFSMGSGIAAGLPENLSLHALVLCAAFTSFKDAAREVGWPRSLACMVPDIWRTRDVLVNYGGPTLIVHGAEDQLFPPQMAAELKRLCGLHAELIVVPGLTHGAPFYNPQPSYWKPIADFLLSGSTVPGPILNELRNERPPSAHPNP